MPLGIKIANQGINALTNTDSKNFSLYIDGSVDHVLVKEKTRGTSTVSAFSTQSVAHGISGIPIYVVIVNTGSYYQWLYGNQNSNGYRTWADTTNIYFRNAAATSKTFTYIIFYDQL